MIIMMMSQLGLIELSRFMLSIFESVFSFIHLSVSKSYAVYFFVHIVLNDDDLVFRDI